MLRIIRGLAFAALLGVGGLGLAGKAEAGFGYGYGYGHGGHYQPTWYWKTVVTYQIVQEPYVKHITVYDDYGCARVVAKTFYRTVQVPVTTRVKVFY